MRGRKSYGRDRCTLHKKHLAAFSKWLNHRGGWEIQPPTKSAYEVLYAIKFSPQGTEAWSFIYRNDRNDHLTVQEELVPLVKQWLKERKQNAMVRRD